MFIGHFAVGLMAKRAAPRTSLGTLFLAAQFADLLWPVLLLTGVEGVRIEPGNTLVCPLDFFNYPWSHSLLTLSVWGVGFGLVYGLMVRYPRGGIVAALVVASHWGLDYLVHRPDLPLTPDGPEKYGLGLWNSLPATAALEFGLLALGVWMYVGATRAENRRGKVVLWSLIIVLAAIEALNLGGTPPPDVKSLAYSALGIWLFVFWGAWADRNRRVVRGMR